VGRIEEAATSGERVGSTTRSCRAGACEPEEVLGCAGPIGWGRIGGRSNSWLVGLDHWAQVIDYWSITLVDE
jgi:hypothetical protein